ncbi:MAG: hypothetical protein Q4G66_00510 [bacterium]|nr:hypothetical protein [bacterium]
MGGLSKKSTFISSIHTTTTPALLLDAGNMLFKTRSLPGDKREAEAARIRARGLVAANRQIGLGFAGIGTNDLAAGPAFLKDISGKDFTWLSLNLVEEKSGRSLFPGSTKVQAAGLTIAVLAVTNHESAAAAVANGGSYGIRPWREVLPQRIAQLRPEVDILILLSNYPLSENQEIARSCPQLDMIFQSGFAMGNLPPLAAGNALISQTEIRGRYLGLLEIDWQGHGPWQQRARGATGSRTVGSSFNQRFIPLNSVIADNPAMDAVVQRIEQQARAAAN